MARKLSINVPWAVASAALALAAMVLWLVVFPSTGTSSSRKEKTSAPLLRLAANAWNSGEISTSSTEPQIFYDKTVPVNTHAVSALYVTLTATSDTHDFATLRLSCWVNEADCDSYGNPVTVGNHADMDWHDNAITQTWCVPVSDPSGPRDIQLGMESGGDGEGGSVYMEHVVVTVDAANLAGSCLDTPFIGGDARHAQH